MEAKQKWEEQELARWKALPPDEVQKLRSLQHQQRLLVGDGSVQDSAHRVAIPRRQGATRFCSTEKQMLPDLKEPGPFDVICARGKEAIQHSGNKRLRALIRIELANYNKATKKNEKSLIVSTIVGNVRLASPSGGFVKFDQESGHWWEVGDIIAREKVGQIFRDALYAKYKSSTRMKVLKKSCEKTGTVPKHKFPPNYGVDGPLHTLAVSNKDIMHANDEQAVLVLAQTLKEESTSQNPSADEKKLEPVADNKHIVYLEDKGSGNGRQCGNADGVTATAKAAAIERLLNNHNNKGQGSSLAMRLGEDNYQAERIHKVRQRDNYQSERMRQITQIVLGGRNKSTSALHHTPTPPLEYNASSRSTIPEAPQMEATPIDRLVAEKLQSLRDSLSSSDATTTSPSASSPKLTATARPCETQVGATSHLQHDTIARDSRIVGGGEASSETSTTTGREVAQGRSHGSQLYTRGEDNHSGPQQRLEPPQAPDGSISGRSPRVRHATSQEVGFDKLLATALDEVLAPADPTALEAYSVQSYARLLHRLKSGILADMAKSPHR